MRQLAASLTPTLISTGLTALPLPHTAGHLIAPTTQAPWKNKLVAPGAFDLLITPGSTVIAVTVGLLYEWYQRTLTFDDDVVTFTNSTNIVNAATHGRKTGDGPVYFVAGAGTLPAEIIEGDPYWVIFEDANTFSVANSLENAMQETVHEFTDDGSGTLNIIDDPSDANGNGITKQLICATLLELGLDGDGAISLTSNVGYTKRAIPHRNECVGYSVSATLDTGTLGDVAVIPRPIF